MSERDYVAADDLAAFLAEKDTVCGEPETLPTGRVVTCTKPRGHLAHSAPGCVWEHPGYTRARSERDAALRRIRELEGDLTESRNGRAVDVEALVHQRDMAMEQLKQVRARLDVSARQAGAVADVPWPECLPALCSAYADALNRISDILDGIGDE